MAWRPREGLPGRNQENGGIEGMTEELLERVNLELTGLGPDFGECDMGGCDQDMDGELLDRLNLELLGLRPDFGECDEDLDEPSGQNLVLLRPRLLRRITCSQTFRDLAEDTFPGLNKSPTYWRLIQYLIFGTFFDHQSQQLIVSQRILAEIEGRSDTINHYCARDLLLAFQQDVMSPEIFAWTGCGKGMCRQVKTLTFPAGFQKAIGEEWDKSHHDEGRVYFADGRKFSRAKEKAEREECKTFALSRQAEVGCPEAQAILEYMNGLPPNLFSKIRENIPTASAIAETLENEDAKKIQRSLLKSIGDQPQPFYGPSAKGNTDRIFEIGGGITNLERSVRRALTPDWFEADIKSSQLAICAMLWKVDEVERFLEAGGCIWEHLYERIGIHPDQRARSKPAIKEALYSTCYGMRIPNIKGRLTKALRKMGIDRRGQRFIESPLIHALLIARENAMARIRDEGGATTCFGKRLSTAQFSERSILAQVAQAVEMWLVNPAIELAKKTDEFKIVLWQHDGFSAHFARRGEMWRKRIALAVNERIAGAGVKSRLEWKE